MLTLFKINEPSIVTHDYKNKYNKPIIKQIPWTSKPHDWIKYFHVILVIFNKNDFNEFLHVKNYKLAENDKKNKDLR